MAQAKFATMSNLPELSLKQESRCVSELEFDPGSIRKIGRYISKSSAQNAPRWIQTHSRQR